ncbi:MAG: glutamate--tRNA ligase family protein [Candidatus Paceibacterota bacterium]
MNNTNKVITRFAPSPTGHFHVGGIRSALYNFLFARQNNGTYILRSEDTDKERSRREYEDEFLELFEWLGLKHDLFFRQSDRLEIHQKYIQKMIEGGFAYISKETPTEEGQREEVIRFKNPNKKITFNDLVLGDITVDTTDLGDFIIARDINEPLYHLTAVIDDFEMGITHVIRGQEHTPNTARQILIQEAIGAPRPIYAHLPLILNKERAKLSKRDESVLPAIEYKRLGYLPDALLNFMALNGWNPGGEQEVFSLSELIEKFDISKIQKGGGVFNPEKLDWLNKEHMKLMPESERNQEILSRLKNNSINGDEKFLQKLCPIIFDHISKWGDIDEMVRGGELDYYWSPPQYEKDLLFWKGNQTPEETKKHLQFVLNVLENTPEESFLGSEEIKNLLFDYATQNGRGEVLWPLRVAMSGRDKSPDPFTLIYIMGRDETVSRINQAIKKLS